MEDLINLTSAAAVKHNVELPTPLIPSPDNDSQENKPISPNPRKSIDNNPFDMVFRKTSEYASKSSDPFEIVFEKAITNEIEDLPPRKKHHSDFLKLNKTLDDSLINTSRLNLMVTPKSSRKLQKNNLPLISIDPPSPNHDSSILNQSAMNDSFQTFTDRLSMSKKLSSLSMTPTKLDKSILNNSAMNDSLSASADSSDDCCFLKSLIAQRVSMCIEKGTLEAKLLDNESDHNYMFRRSFSQGDRLTPKKSKIKRSMSIVNDRKNSLLSESSVPSILFEDPFNRAFMQRELCSYSSTTDYSDVSAITRLNSVCSGSFYSCTFTNDTVNKGFINSGEISGEDKSLINGSNLQDLVERFNNLRMKSDGGSGCSVDQSGAKSGGDESDSVFLDEDKSDSIFLQANVLAKTFEDLASTTTRGSSSSGDNLLSSLPSHLELSSECSVPSINLIDLPLSPKQFQSNPGTSSETANPPEAAQMLVNKEIEHITQLEKEFLDSDKEIVAANLLRDLEKLVKNENNPVAMELLANLEKALDVKPDNNSKLLNTICMQKKSANQISENPVNLLEKLNKSSDKNLENVGEIKHKDEVESNEEVAGCSSGDNTHQDPEASQQEDDPNLDKSICKISKSVSPPPQLSADSFTNQKFILDLQLALSKLLEGCKDEPVLLLENLNKVLNTKPKESRIPMSPRKSTLAPVKLTNLPEYQKSPKIAKTFPLRRRSSVTQALENEKKSESVRLDSPKREVKRRNSRNPDARNVDDNKRISVNLKLKTTLPVVNKTKLKKKSDAEIKRGPMKALVPLVKMQCPRPGKKESTPPKKHKPSALNLVSSTPDPHEMFLVKKKNKTKPVASSTPDVQQVSWRRASQIPQSPKANMSWNISPVTPNAKENINDVMRRNYTPKKVDRSFEKPSKGGSASMGSKKIGDRLRGGRRSEPVLLSPRVDKSKNNRVTSPGPLKEKNSIKTKPMNLNVKFRGRSGSLGHVEKENKF